jgi:hypothetical protein
LRNEARKADEAELERRAGEAIDLPEESCLEEGLADAGEEPGQCVVAEIGNVEGDERPVLPVTGGCQVRTSAAIAVL